MKNELERIRPKLEAVDEDLDVIYKDLTKHINAKAKEGESPSNMKFRFLSAPTEVVVDGNGNIIALRVENTELYKRGEDIAAKGTGTHTDIEVDTVVFAIGDRVDETLGLPCTGTEYVKNPNPDPDNPGDEAYQVFDPQSGKLIDGYFVIGWSRKASDGLVGKAKQDGEKGIVAVNHYLEKVTPGSAEGAGAKSRPAGELLKSRGVRFIEYSDIQKLEAVEKKEAEKRGAEFFKYSTDRDMLSAIESN
ncbi:MAG: hypothetical protein IPO77_12100 [Acidobacteria bacterium]|nr:hypothetical protein [Acidobacteriota bacterium]